MKRIIECVPNFSEGRNLTKIKAITDAIEKVEGVKLLDVDPGKATNRTVVTFVGEPEAVIEGGFQAIKKAYEVIDMSQHKGEHPRFGAVDVCPLVPVSGVTMEECVKYAHQLGKRVGEELGLSGYFYESAATRPERKNLATVRSGEYEGLTQKLAHPDWEPDFGPAEFNPKYGVTAMGARDFLIAYNVNLNTTSTRRANSVAFDVRENGRIRREGGTLSGKIIRDSKGTPLREPGVLKAVKAIGWYIEEYGICQISMNLTNISITSIHEAFDAVERSANRRGMRVTGSELVGLIPKNAMIAAGKHYLTRQGRSTGIAEEEIIKIAIKSMGLDELAPFDPKKKIIEYLLEDDQYKLVDKSVKTFADETASESPAPGGGSISAYVGALGVSLGAMVANLSAHKRGWDDKIAYFSDVADRGQGYKERLLYLVDEDTNAFNKIMEAIRLPKKTEEEKTLRSNAMVEATKYAIEIPLQVMQTSLESMDLMVEMAEKGLAASVSDAGVGAMCARTAVLGAWLNVQINAKDLKDQAYKEKVLKKGHIMAEQVKAKEAEILAIVQQKLS